MLAPGCYVYAGSARGPGGIRARVRRHLRPDKTPHWHIDQVTAYAKLPLGELSPQMSLVMLDEAGQDIEEVQSLLAA